jgi:hypothetical protein
VRIFAAEMAQGGWRAPHNWQARLLEYRSDPEGTGWQRRLLAQGTGTHEAVVADIDDDGELEVVGKDWREPCVQMWRPHQGPSHAARLRHRLIDRDKPAPSAAIVAADPDGRGADDIFCGPWRYRGPDWARARVDGVDDVLAVLGPALVGAADGALVLLDGPSATRLGELPEGRVAVATIAPDTIAVASSRGLDLHVREGDSWSARTVEGVSGAAGVAAADVDGDGRVDLVAGTTWLRNVGGGIFEPRQIETGLDLVPLAAVAGDLDGDGRVEIVLGVEGPDVELGAIKYRPLGRLLVLTPDDGDRWDAHLIDSLRNPRNLALADLDGDGELELVAAEHDPSWPYRSQARVYVYERADPHGRTWTRTAIEDRFEHDNGPAVVRLVGERIGLASHGSTDSRAVHVWEPTDA